jgi:hypothetical protein
LNWRQSQIPGESVDQLEPNDSFLNAIDRGLNVFGENVHIVLYFELQKSQGISREEIPLKPQLFVEFVNQFFGVGAAVVSRSIRKELEITSGIKGLTSKDLLTALRTAFHEISARSR